MKLSLLFICSWLLIQGSSALSPHRAMILLSKYGYLSLPKLESLNNPDFERSLISDGSYKKAIKKFQTIFNLPRTGFLTSVVEQMLTAKRCGNPDFGTDPLKFRTNIRKSKRSKGLLRRFRRYFIDNPHMKWLKNDLTWKIKSYPSKILNQPQVRSTLTRAFNKWSSHVNVNYAETTDYYSDADIVIEFGSKEHGDSIPFDGPNYVLAHAFYPSGSPNPIYSRAGDAHFDDDETWIDDDLTKGRNLLAVAVHELGHSMGLGHSASEKAIMYPFYVNPIGKEIELDIDDIKGMQQIYGEAERNKFLPHVPDIPKDPRIFTIPTITKAPITEKKINFCDTTIDAIILIRGVELYVFSGPLQWRIDFSKTVTSWISYELRDGPEDLTYYWPILPKSVDGIDGGIERTDQKIYMFRNSKFWLLENNNALAPNVPVEGLPLTVLGLPKLKKIDTIFRWNYNEKIYIMAGDQYWKIDEKSGDFGHIYARYPRPIKSIWKNLPLPIDVAYTGLHGKTFFIKNKYYYEFNNLEMKITGGPKRLTTPWIGCRNGQ